MDNFKIALVAEGLNSLKAAFAIAFEHNGGSKAKSYALRKIDQDDFSDPLDSLANETALVFRWDYNGKTDSHNLLFQMNSEAAAEHAHRWLAEQEYKMEPDHDGDNGRGFAVWTGTWGHINGDHYAIVAVAPAWAMYGK